MPNSVLNFAAQQYDVYNSYTSGLDTVRMFIDGINTYDNDAYDFQTIATCEEAYLSNVRLTNGTHSLTTTVRDKAGNETSETIYFTVDAPDNAAAAVTVTPDLCGGGPGPGDRPGDPRRPGQRRLHGAEAEQAVPGLHGGVLRQL